MKTAGEAPQVAPKKRPMRLAGRRQRELMCQILRDSDVEWINEDQDIEGMETPFEIPIQTGTPVIGISDCMAIGKSLACSIQSSLIERIPLN